MNFEDIKKANEQIRTTTISKKDKKTGQTISKEYAEVNQRIKAFRMCYPEGFIKTEIVSLENGVCIISAQVGEYENGETHLLGTGTAYEKEGSTFINQSSYIENCETSAVGRALGMAGFGIDTSVASAEEVQNAMANQDRGATEAELAEAGKIVELDKLAEYLKKDIKGLTKAELDNAVQTKKRKLEMEAKRREKDNEV